MSPSVLYVTPIFGYPPFGGPRLRTYNTLRALARCADVSVYLTAQPDTPDREAARQHLLTFCRDVRFPAPPPARRGARTVLRQIVPAPLRAALRAAAHRLGRARRAAPRAEAPAARDPAEIAALEAWIAAHSPDLLWLGFGGISYDLVPLKQRTGRPLVLETECVWSRFILRELPFATDAAQREGILQAGRAKAAEERRGAAQVDLTTAVSEVDAMYFRDLADDPSRVMLLANVIDVDAYVDFAPTGDVRQPAVVFAGTLSNGTANVDAAVWLIDQVMPRVWRYRPDVHLYVVGRSPTPPIVARRGPHVHVTGEVPSIAPYLRAAAAALVPLRWESGTRFKILEAFACRTPVISTTLGAEGLAVEHGRHLLLADDADAFAGAIVSVLDDPALGASLVEPAYDLVRAEYDLGSAERQVSVILERLGFGASVATA